MKLFNAASLSILGHFPGIKWDSLVMRRSTRNFNIPPPLPVIKLSKLSLPPHVFKIRDALIKIIDIVPLIRIWKAKTFWNLGIHW